MVENRRRMYGMDQTQRVRDPYLQTNPHVFLRCESTKIPIISSVLEVIKESDNPIHHVCIPRARSARLTSSGVNPSMFSHTVCTMVILCAHSDRRV